MNGSVPWNKLKNEVATEYNDFNIIRGKEYIKIGKRFWLGYFCLVDGSGGLTIGDDVTLASGVHVYTHDSTKFRVFGGEKDVINGTHVEKKPVVIGNNVQIGAGSIILMGVTIGDNVVIGASSLVNKDIPSNSVAVGNPAKVIKKVDMINKEFIK